LAFSPNNRSLVSGSKDGTAIVWDIRHGRALLRLEGHRGTVGKVVYAPHGALIATVSHDDKSTKIWDASIGACLHSFEVRGHIFQVAFSPNNSRDRIATASWDDRVKIWSAVTGEELLTIDHPRKLSYPVAFSPDGSEVLAACDADETAVTFDSRTGRLRRVHQLSGTLQHASYSARGEYIVLGDNAHNLHVRDAKSGAFLAKFEALSYESFRTDGPQFLFQGQNLVVDLYDGLSLLHDVRDVLRLR
ncbi:uncharacterized protein PHACADRAFT_87282, partial [Phanerochaete carnosa HHB-10118-sp]